MGLLETLAAKMRLEYLSDLTSLTDLKEIKAIIKSIPDSRYSLAEWNDAVQYLTKGNKQFVSVSEAKEFLLEF